jgi:hypothetical protein
MKSGISFLVLGSRLHTARLNPIKRRTVRKRKRGAEPPVQHPAFTTIRNRAQSTGRTGSAFQISFAYSAIVRSLENQPIDAVLMTAFRVH